jgi:hypothetical protein
MYIFADDGNFEKKHQHTAEEWGRWFNKYIHKSNEKSTTMTINKKVHNWGFREEGHLRSIIIFFRAGC